MQLAHRTCTKIAKGTPPLSAETAGVLLSELSSWNVTSDNKRIQKTYKFKDWQEASVFVQKVSELAQLEDHHPDIDLHWGRVGISLSTHSVGGLSENDFILAAKIDTIQ